MRRSILTLLLIAAMLLMLTACGGRTPAETSMGEGESYEVLDTGAEGKTETTDGKESKEKTETTEEKTSETAVPQQTSSPKSGSAPAAGGTNDGADGYASAARYNAIELGMTYDEVKKIMGSGGEQVSTSEMNGDEYATYQWLTEDSSGNAAVALKNGKVTSKMQMNVSQTEPVATKAIFDKIKEGMKYSEVKALFGCDGAVTYMDSDEDYGYEYTEYMWSGANNTFIQVVFENDKVVMTNQSGL